MTLHLYPLIGVFLLLLALVLFIRASLRLRKDERVYEPDRQDLLTAELGKRILSSEDFAFVTRENPGRAARSFEQERTVLALAWLCGLRTQVQGLFRSHLVGARRTPDLKPAVELRLGLHFLAFQIATGLLYAGISVWGPLASARLLAVSLRLSEKLSQMARDVFPAAADFPSQSLELEPPTRASVR